MNRLDELVRAVCQNGVNHIAIGQLIKQKRIIMIAPSIKIKRNDYLVDGATPIISQEAEYISGYCNLADKNIPKDNYMCFGDHSEHIKFIDFAEHCRVKGCTIHDNYSCGIALTGNSIYIEDNNFYAFKKHYCKFGGFKNKQVMGYKNLDQLQNMLDECMIRRLKSEILDLPEKNIYEEYVEMDQLQETLYTYVRESTLLEMESMLTSANPLVQMIRMRQATGNTWTLENSLNIPQFTSVRCAKLERLKDIVKERTDNGQKIIVFTNWVQVALKLKEELKEYNPQMIHGEVKTREKQIAEEEFQTNPDCKVLIGTIGSMGTGLNLTAANCVIFMDEPWTYSNFSQAIDRAHRIGTKGQIDIISLITKNTIDERIHNLILSKKNISDLVVDGNKKNKESIIKYLLGLIGDEELNSSNN